MNPSLISTSRRDLLIGGAAAAGLSAAPAFVRAQGSRRSLKVSIGRIPWAAGNSPMSQYMINNKLLEKRAADFAQRFLDIGLGQGTPSGDLVQYARQAVA